VFDFHRSRWRVSSCIHPAVCRRYTGHHITVVWRLELQNDLHCQLAKPPDLRRFPIPTPQVSCVGRAPFLLLGLHTTTRLQTLVCTSRQTAVFPFTATCSTNLHARSPAPPLVVSWHTVSRRTASWRHELASIATFLQEHSVPCRPFSVLTMTMAALGRQTVRRVTLQVNSNAFSPTRGDR
jgi:hypothetical protein